jgi:hypothetical protein
MTKVTKYDSKTLASDVDELFPFLYGMKCDSCGRLPFDAKLLPCSHTLCGGCVLKRNKHCVVCGDYTDGEYTDNNVVNNILKNLVSDYDTVLENIETEFDYVSLYKDYVKSPRYGALFKHVLRFLETEDCVDDIVNFLVELGYKIEEVKNAVSQAFKMGYFAFIKHKDGHNLILTKGCISEHLNTEWDNYTLEERFYLYVISTSMEKSNWDVILKKFDDLNRFILPVDSWVLSYNLLTEAPELLDCDYEFTPDSESLKDVDNFSYTTDVEWKNHNEGFSDSDDDDELDHECDDECDHDHECEEDHDHECEDHECEDDHDHDCECEDPECDRDHDHDHPQKEDESSSSDYESDDAPHTKLLPKPDKVLNPVYNPPQLSSFIGDIMHTVLNEMIKRTPNPSVPIPNTRSVPVNPPATPPTPATLGSAVSSPLSP